MRIDETISILICSRDRRKALEKLAGDLHKMKTDYSFQLVVVEETDNPSPIDGSRYISCPIADRGFPYARNLALKNAAGEIIVFLDDDCIISDGWLDGLIDPFKDKTVVGVQGGVTVPESTTSIGWAESILGFPGGGISRVSAAEGKNQRTREISTLNCAYRKWVLDRIEGFYGQLKLGGEDYLLAKMVSDYGQCLFVPAAIVSHQPRGSLIKIWQWFVRRGRAEIGVIRTGRQQDTTYWTLFRGSLMIKLGLLILLGFIFFNFFIIPVLFFPRVFFFLQYLRYYRSWRNSRATLKPFILIPLVKLTMDTAIDWGRIRGIVFD